MIDADARFDVRLKNLKSASETDPVTKKEAPDFRFVLQDAMDALKSNADMAREYMETTHDQKERFGEERNSFASILEPLQGLLFAQNISWLKLQWISPGRVRPT